jgi:hypothetical protein
MAGAGSAKAGRCGLVRPSARQRAGRRGQARRGERGCRAARRAPLGVSPKLRGMGMGSAKRPGRGGAAVKPCRKCVIMAPLPLMNTAPRSCVGRVRVVWCVVRVAC